MPKALELLLFGLTATFSASARAEDVSGLVLETGSPDAFCPDLVQTREAVSRRLGSLVVEGRRGWRARYTIGHAPEGSPRDFVRLELFNSEGASELVRDLPTSGESCSTMAEVIALVLDRHFRSLSPEERQIANVEERPSTRSSPPLEVLGPAPPERAAPHAPIETEARPPRGLLFAEFALAPSRAPAVGVRALTPLGRSLYLGGVLLVDIAYERERLPMDGEARAGRGELRGWLAWGTGSYPWFAYVGPSLGLSLQRGETRNLADDSSLLRALWAGGLEGGAVWRLSRTLAVALSGAATATVPSLSGRFYVSDQEVLEPRVFSAQVGLAAGYAF